MSFLVLQSVHIDCGVLCLFLVLFCGTLTFLAHCLCGLVLGPCFVLRHFVSFLVLQSNRIVCGVLFQVLVLFCGTLCPF